MQLEQIFAYFCIYSPGGRYTYALAVKNIQVNFIFDFIQVCLRSLRKNKFFHSLVFTFSLVCAYIRKIQ